MVYYYLLLLLLFYYNYCIELTSMGQNLKIPTFVIFCYIVVVIIIIIIIIIILSFTAYAGSI